MADKHDRSKPHRHELPQHPSAEFEFFPTSKRKAIQSRSPNLFVSAKAATAIPTRHPALQDALIQASLDPAVRSIDYIATAAVGSEQVNLGAIVVQRDDGRFAPGSRLLILSNSTLQLSGTRAPASLMRMRKKLLPHIAPGARATSEADAARSRLSENLGFQFPVVDDCGTQPPMKTKKLTEALERVEAWPPHAQNELAEFALELDAGFKDGEYEPTPEELAGIDRGLRAAAEGRFAGDREVEAVFAKFRGSP